MMEPCDNENTPDCALPVVLRAGCKINLNLWITSVRPDGWHELDSIFLHLPLPADTLTILPGERPGISVECETPGIDPAENTLTTAWAAFEQSAGHAPNITIRLEKGIPHGAGLGGGSSDAAALLQWLNTTCRTPLDDDALYALGAGIGADVPFFLQHGPCRVTGIGDRLASIAHPLPDVHLVLVCPPEHVPTPWAYKAWDNARSGPASPSLTVSGAHAIRLASIDAGGKQELVLTNDFEPVVFAAYPAVRACKELLLRLGAQGACMSGSGSSVFGLFRDKRTAESAADEIRLRHPECGVFAHELADVS